MASRRERLGRPPQHVRKKMDELTVEDPWPEQHDDSEQEDRALADSYDKEEEDARREAEINEPGYGDDFGSEEL